MIVLYIYLNARGILVESTNVINETGYKLLGTRQLTNYSPVKETK